MEEADAVLQRVMKIACRRAGRCEMQHWGRYWMRCLTGGFRAVYPPDRAIQF